MTAHLADTPVLTTERLVLRAPCASDFEAFGPFVMSGRARFVGGGADKDAGQAWRILAIFAGHWHLRGYGIFVAEHRADGRPVGSAGPWFPGDWPEPELGWTIWDAKDEGRGYAREAVQAVRRHAYADLGWSTAVSYIDPRNDRSRTLARRLGCTLDADAVRPERDPALEVWRHPAPSEVAA